MPIDPDTQKMLFAGFFFAFAVKAPMFPVHTWLPDAAAVWHPGTNTLLVGVLDKVGDVRHAATLVLPIFPDASEWAAPVRGHAGCGEHRVRRAWSLSGRPT